MEHPLRRPELLVCAWRGHVLPGATMAPVDARHRALVRETVDGRRVVQCLRCASWLLATAPAAGAASRAVEPAAVARPRRGHALRQALVLRLIALDRAAHTLAFGAVAVAALVLHWKFGALHSWAQSTLDALSSARSGSGGASAHGILAALLTHLARLRPHDLVALAVLAGVYAVVSAFEAYGLWRERRWAEYLTALATAGFLPLEVHELLKRVTFVRVGAIIVNAAILVYLVVSKHLFGIAGAAPSRADADPLEPLPDLLPLDPARTAANGGSVAAVPFTTDSGGAPPG